MCDLAKWKKANPWILQNIQNGNSMCGRFPTRREAEEAAAQRGGVVEVCGQVVYFSEMPRL